MAKKKTSEWEELIRTGLYPFNVSIPIHSIQYSNRFLNGPKYQKICLYLENTVAYYYENFSDHARVGTYCLKTFLKSHKTFKNYCAFWHKEFALLDSFFTKTNKTDFSTLTKIELADLILQVYKKTLLWHGITYNVDAIDVMLNPLFDPLIDTTYPNAKESKKAKIKNTLTYPNVLSYVNRFYLEKLKLFDFITKNGIKKSEKRIDTFIKKYFWINFSWEQARVYTKKNLLSDYKKSNKKSIIPEIQKIKASISNSLRQKKQIVHIIGQRNPIVTTYLEIFDAYAVFHDLRKEGQVKAVALLRKLYKELSKKIGTDASILYYFWPQEAASIAYKKNKIDVELAQKRHAKWFYEYSNDGTFKEWYGEEAQQKRNALTDFEKIVRDKEFCGVTASTGRVTGTARICLSSKDANDRIAEGDILVTGMTMPEFVPAMKKAAAVVTDEGGLTCHAAIICRELSIPCVVGTKSATKILRDGDSVEVNANHGVIKITKRSSYER